MVFVAADPVETALLRIRHGVEVAIVQFLAAHRIEGRIADLEGKLANAQIIDPTTLDADGRIVFGATVELEDVESGEPVTYQIVGDDEADIKQGKISVSSPIARALIGKYAGDSVDVQAPAGVRQYEVLDVLYK